MGFRFIPPPERVQENKLSLLIVRLPGLANGDLLPGAAAGDQLDLREDDLRSPAPGKPVALRAAALKRLVQVILRVHDLQQVARLGSMRHRTLAALLRCGQQPRLSRIDAAIHLDHPPRWSLVPSGRPPGISELHAASCCDDPDYAPRRIVVGHVGSLPAERRRQMDWAIDGRNVEYCDVTMLDSLIPKLMAPRP